MVAELNNVLLKTRKVKFIDLPPVHQLHVDIPHHIVYLRLGSQEEQAVLFQKLTQLHSGQNLLSFLVILYGLSGVVGVHGSSMQQEEVSQHTVIPFQQ
jgi:hypothetical protein